MGYRKSVVIEECVHGYKWIVFLEDGLPTDVIKDHASGAPVPSAAGSESVKRVDSS